MIKSAFYNVKNGLRGLWYWLPYAWRWRSWDYQYVLDGIEHGLKALEVAVREGCSVDGPKRAKEIRIVLELLRRHREDVYPSKNINAYLQGRERDWQMLWANVAKEMQRWWD